LGVYLVEIYLKNKNSKSFSKKMPDVHYVGKAIKKQKLQKIDFYNNSWNTLRRN